MPPLEGADSAVVDAFPFLCLCLYRWLDEKSALERKGDRVRLDHYLVDFGFLVNFSDPFKDLSILILNIAGFSLNACLLVLSADKHRELLELRRTTRGNVERSRGGQNDWDSLFDSNSLRRFRGSSKMPISD